jgi:DNA-binding CsgD family transcriptional regulator
MAKYNLDKIFESYTDSNIAESVDFKKYKFFLNQYIEFSKPDFVALLSVSTKDTILYEKNFNLEFDNSQKESLVEIIASVDQDQIDKILLADKYCMKFVDSNKLAEASIMFQLRYTVTLQKGNTRTFLRKISFVRNKHSKTPEPILLISIFDVTGLVGIKKDPHINIKYISNYINKKEDKLVARLADFKEKVNGMLRDDIKLTRREKEILGLISKGRTSDQIAEKLFISVSTVNTHRQNLIKKFNVKNTSALIHMV